jgi:hypothetical protein
MGTCTLHALAMRSSLELRDAVRLDLGPVTAKLCVLAI